MKLKITALSLRDSARNRGAHCVAICPHLQIHNFGLFSRFHYKGYFMQDYGLLRSFHSLTMTKWENFKYAGLWIATLAFAMTEDKMQDKRARIGCYHSIMPIFLIQRIFAPNCYRKRHKLMAKFCRYALHSFKIPLLYGIEHLVFLRRIQPLSPTS